MLPRFRPWISSAILGLIVGAIWEGFGKTYLWTLATPQDLVYALALLLWIVLGLVVATVLREIEKSIPHAKEFIKFLAGPAAIAGSAAFRSTGLITFPDVWPSVFGVPLYMMTGSLALVYLMDLIGWHREA